MDKRNKHTRDLEFEDFERQVNSLWTTRIFREFDRCNRLVEERLGEALRRPAVFVGDGCGRYGSWDAGNRTMLINRQLLRGHAWDDAVDTIRHEMAHMVVDEIFVVRGVRSDGSHGELFDKACAVLDLDSRKLAATRLEREGHGVRGGVVAKVRKLLALSGSDIEGEAAAALEKARLLMEKFNIEHLGRADGEKVFAPRPVGRHWGRVPRYVKRLAGIVAANYFVQHIFCHTGRGRYLEFFGEPENLDIAEHVFHFLLAEGERQWEAFSRRQRRLGGRGYSRGAFIEGVYEGFAANLAKAKTSSAESAPAMNTLPVGANDPLLKKEFSRCYPSVRSWSYRGGYAGVGASHGRAAGAGIKIHPAVKGRGGAVGLLNG